MVRKSFEREGGWGATKECTTERVGPDENPSIQPLALNLVERPALAGKHQRHGTERKTRDDKDNCQVGTK